MKSRRILPTLVAILTIGLLSGCGKGKSSEKTESAVSGDYIMVEASHAKPKPEDPIAIQLTKFNIKEVAFESPDNLEGATATVVIDVASIKSNKKGRDKHLRESDYLDTESFGVSTVVVSNVKRLDTASYSANLKVSLHGQEDTWQVDFVVAEKTADSVTIELQHTFERRSFGIGAEDSSPAQDVLAKARLTFKKP